METDSANFNVELSSEIQEMIHNAKKGTNLSSAEVITLIIKQYFKKKP